MRARHDYRRSLERVTDPDCAPGLRAGRDHLPDVVPEALATQARGGRGLRSPLIVHTISPAEITFDPAKDVTNTAKHGVSLALASELEWADLMAQADTRRDYGEDRMIGYTPIGERVFCVVFMDRDDQRRILYMDAPYIASTYGLSESGSDCINISGL